MILEQQRKFKSNKLIWRVKGSFICADASCANASKVLENKCSKEIQFSEVSKTDDKFTVTARFSSKNEHE